MEEKYPESFDLLAKYVKEIQFGSITLQIQDGKIIQIDKSEKFRFDRPKAKVPVAEEK